MLGWDNRAGFAAESVRVCGVRLAGLGNLGGIGQYWSFVAFIAKDAYCTRQFFVSIVAIISIVSIVATVAAVETHGPSRSIGSIIAMAKARGRRWAG